MIAGIPAFLETEHGQKLMPESKHFQMINVNVNYALYIPFGFVCWPLFRWGSKYEARRTDEWGSFVHWPLWRVEDAKASAPEVMKAIDKQQRGFYQKNASKHPTFQRHLDRWTPS